MMTKVVETVAADELAQKADEKESEGLAKSFVVTDDFEAAADRCKAKSQIDRCSLSKSESSFPVS